MKPAELTPERKAFWADYVSRETVFTAPGELERGIEPCRGLVTFAGPDHDYAHQVARVPWVPDEQERAAIAAGGTIWLSCWGGLPVHNLIVQPAGDR